MTTINAATIYAEVQAARLALAAKIEDFENSPAYKLASLSDQFAMNKSFTAGLDSFVTFRTSEKGSMRIANTLQRLDEFAAIVKSKAAIFGGGFPKAERKPKPAVTWSAQAIKVACEAVQDGDYAGALQLAEEKLGGFFVVASIHDGNKFKPRANLILAPMPVEGLPENFTSARMAGGDYQVFDLVSGFTIDGPEKTRSKAEARAIAKWNSIPAEKRDQAMAKAKKLDQQEACAQWMAERGLGDSAEIERFARIAADQLAEFEEKEAEKLRLAKEAQEAKKAQHAAEWAAHIAAEQAAIDAQVAEAVAQVVAMAQAVAVIEQAQAVPADEAQELATVCEGEASEGQTLNMGRTAQHSTPTNPAAGRAPAIPASQPGRQDSTGSTPTPCGGIFAPSPTVAEFLDAPAGADDTGGGEGRPSENETVPTVSAGNFLSDIPANLAQSAYSGTSYSPERRGTRARNEYSQTMAADLEELRAQAIKGDTLDLLPEVFARYRARQAGAYRAYLASSSRIVSSFIAGGSNFPAARMNKRADIAHKRLTEYLEGGEMAKRAAVRTLRPDLRAIMAGDADATDRLAAKIASAERLQETMKAANKAIRTHAKAGEARQVAGLMELGFSESTAVALLHPRFSHQGQGFASYSLTNNNANIRRMKERLESITQAQACEVVETEGADGVRIEDDAPANRVRLFFPGKPSAEIRATLKSAGFRWAPSIGAWQAYRNRSTLQTAQEVAGKPCEAEPVQSIEPAAIEAPAEIPAPAACEIPATVEPAPVAPAQPAEPAPVAPILHKQKAAGKSGAWHAELYKIEAVFVLRFFSLITGLAWLTSHHATAGERVRALQALAAGADAAKLAQFVEAFDVLESSGAQVRAMDGATFSALAAHLEGINYHSEHLMLQCLRAGRDDLASAAAHVVRYQRAPSYESLPADVSAARHFISCALSGRDAGPISPAAAAWLKAWGLTQPEPTPPATPTPAASANESSPADARPADEIEATPPPVAEFLEAAYPPVAEFLSDAPGVGGGAHPNSEPAFERAQPFNLDPRELLTAGVTAAQLVGLGVKYAGDMANPSGQGAITEVNDTRGETWGELRIVCTLEDGRTVNAEPHYFTESIRPILQFNGKHHGAPYLAELAMAVMLRRSSESSAAELVKQAHAKALAALPLEFPYLQAYQPGGKLRGCTLAAANIRAMLKKAFPGVKFSVKSRSFSMGNAIDVNWTDGPTDAQTSEITGRFKAGSFDGMTDSYRSSSSAFTELFGESMYIHTRRELSDGLIQAAIDQHYQGQADKPSIDDYRKASGRFSWSTWGNDSDRRRFDETINAMKP